MIKYLVLFVLFARLALCHGGSATHNSEKTRISENHRQLVKPSSHDTFHSHASSTIASRSSKTTSHPHKPTHSPDWSSIGHNVTQIWCSTYTIIRSKPNHTQRTTLTTSVNCSQTVVYIPPQTTGRITKTQETTKHKPTSESTVHDGGAHHSSTKTIKTSITKTAKHTSATYHSHSSISHKSQPHDKSTIIGTNKATTAFATPSETTPTSTNFQTTTTASTSRTTATSSSMYAPYTKPPSVPSSGYDPLSTPSTNGVFSDEPLPSITSPITNISTGINNTAGPVPTTVNNASPGYNPESVPGSVSNKAIGIGLGVGIGCVAALGLAGLLIHNRRKQAEGQSLGESNVQTRWRPQSFMAAVAAVASRLSRTPSQRSKLSTLSESDPGRAIGTGQGAVEHPAMSYSPPSLARVEHGASNISR